MPLLSVKDLKVTFKTEDGIVRAVNGLSLSLEAGETLGIVGESGSGKSVTALSSMRLIAMPPGRIESGSIEFNGHNLLQVGASQMRQIRGNIGFLERQFDRSVLAEAGVRAEDVRQIANCHFHSDHSGGNREFPGVPIFVQRAELAHLRTTPDYSHAPSVADFPGATLEEIDGDADPLPGVRIIPTPGHSPGHQSLVVETQAGRVILGGQAFNFSSDYARQRYSLELARRGEPHGPYPEWVARFQDLDPWRVYFAHDTAAWEWNADRPIG